jgi:RNA polymerase sigma-70 factor (ECF subfamily)
MVSERARTIGKTDEELVERVRRGETRQYAQLVARHQDAVYSMALRFVRSSGDAEDIAQEAFLRAYRGLADFKGDARFSTWLHRITWNLCVDWARRQRKPGRAHLPMDDAREVADTRVDLESDLVHREERRAVREALDGLDEKYRVVVSLLYFQKLSYEEIAAVLNVPMKTVETRLYRARRLLKSRLQSAGMEETT